MYHLTVWADSCQAESSPGRANPMFATFLKTTRAKKQQTQQEAAEQIDVHVNTYGSWERGLRPDLPCLFRIADWAGVKVDKLRQHLDGLK